MKKISLITIIAFALLLFVSNCSNQVYRDELPNNSSELIQDNNNDILLSIYCMDPTILTEFPVSIERMKQWCEEPVIVNSDELSTHPDIIDTIDQINIVPTEKTPEYLDVRLYYLFQRENGDKILEVAIWNSDGSFWVNGINTKANDVFFDLISQFLPSDIIDEFKRINAIENRCK